MNKITFFSSLFVEEHMDYYRYNSIGAIANANNNLQWALVKGFIEHDYKIQLLNSPNIGAFPFRFKKILSKGFSFVKGNAIYGNNVGYLNINVLKHLIVYFKFKRLIKMQEQLKDQDVLLIYDVYPSFLGLLKNIKINNSNIKIVLVIPDIYGFTSDKHSFMSKIFMHFGKNVINENIQYVDALVLLTENMIDKLPDAVKEKPRVTIEGIYNPIILDEFKCEIYTGATDKDVILYTGSLDLRHGIINLVDAYIGLKLPHVELHICGDGDGKKILLDKIKNLDSVRYWGQLGGDMILKMQKEAFLLVNPRTSEGEFTKYSFPSKIMEYFSSGTPTLMYRLDGIPAEYYNYCFFPEDESIDALTQKLKEICSMDRGELKKKALAAKYFIVNEKNPYTQIGKILNVIN